MRSGFVWTVGYAAMMLAMGSAAQAQDTGPSYTIFGTPGLLEMPTAESASRSDIAATLSYAGSGGYKTSFNYQLTDRLSGAFRYSTFDNWQIVDPDDPDAARKKQTFDRSFDLQYRLTDESRYLPAIAIGLRDFLGTGRFGSEYIVGSKSVGSDLIVTGGIGWGRLASRNGFTNPLSVLSSSLETRPVYVDRVQNNDDDAGNGGTISINQFFRGDAAFFGGFEYQVTPNLGIKAEYSSNAYLKETFTPAVNVSSPLNFGLTYRPRPGIELNAAYLNGEDLSASATFVINPEKRPTFSGLDPAPAPVRVRTADQRAAQTWDQVKQPEPAVRAGLTQLLKIEGIELVGLEITDRTARLRYENTRFRSEAQAMGRAARMMTQIIPPSVETFILEPTQAGLPLSSTTLPRRQIEALENRVGGTDAIYQAARFGQAGPVEGLVLQPSDTPRLSWGIGPYLNLVIFSGTSSLEADVGIQADIEYKLNRNFVISGQVRQSALGPQEALRFFDNPNDYANVRTDQAFFGRDGDLNLRFLQAAYYTRLAPEVYGRVTAGYLEQMYGGVSTEVLYAPVGSRLAFGAELNYLAMRDQDMGLGFAQYRTERDPVTGFRNRVEDGDYTVLSGHLSAYYDVGNGFQARMDVGRYLAGDWGATFALDHEFENGWKIGGYFTLTDMPFDQFGEGSFDKGIRITIPYDYFIGTPSRRTTSTTLQSLSRDGGARVQVQGRLYDTVRGGQLADIDDTWGRFWR
ncbi:YjbH domain-containing protein [Yoonia sp. R2331]|uniref:YjbH domain-containing protein n=1 Tax=Yoonia sp. R2331 TaxID=3237238 RepID=UPI0034E41101